MGDNYHEKEAIRLVAREPKSRWELHRFLKERGFTNEDDFYFLDRPDQPKPWQSISVMTASVFYQGAAVYETEEDMEEKPGQWDELRVDYLLATLPTSFIETCAVECEALAAQFELALEVNGNPINPGQLRSMLQQIADQVAAEWDAPGSEFLSILIEQSYPRR